MLGIAVERARLYERSILAGALEERNRLAREIHDTLAQGLSAIALRLDTVDALLESGVDGERVEALVTEALEITRANLEEARRTVLDLRAAPLEGRTLAEALRDLVGADATAQLVVDGADRPLPARVEVGLFRIAQELLSNVSHHASAHSVQVWLHANTEKVSLTVEDDGTGFDPGAKAADRFGLTGINERVRLMGGALVIDSTPGVGTRVSVSVPL
jgi:two-component system NarL family sensor kinase